MLLYLFSLFLKEYSTVTFSKKKSIAHGPKASSVHAFSPMPLHLFIQRHRRARALLRFRNVISSGNFSKVVTCLFLLSINYVLHVAKWY